MRLFQYVGAAIGSAIVISLASLIWPKVTTQPRPKPLTQVRQMVMQTPIGQQVATVLGVTDETNAAPVNLGTFVTEQTNTIVTNVEQSAQHAVTSQVLVQLATKFKALPKEEQDQFRTLICTPPKE